MVSLTYLKAESKQKGFTGQTVSGMWPQDADSSKSTKLELELEFGSKTWINIS